MSILVSKNGEPAKWLESTSFQKEEDLQKYIADNPHSIPLSNYKEDSELLIICREFPTRHGESIDHVAIDKDGEIYLIETKLYTNSDKRHVVSQVIDYGATLASEYSSFENFLSNIEEWLSENYESSLQEKIQEHFKIDEQESQTVIQKIENVYTAKKFTFIILMDKADSKIKNFVSFMNANSNFSILLVQFKRYVDRDHEIIIPSLFGSESIRNTSTSSSRREWTEKDFYKIFNENQDLNADTKNAIAKLITYTNSEIPSEWKGYWHQYFGGTGNSPIFKGYLPMVHETRALYQINCKTGELKIKFWALEEKSDLLLSFVEKCKDFKFEMIKKAFDERGGGTTISIKTEDWVPKVDDFISILKKVFQTFNDKI